MSYHSIILTKADGVAVIQMNNPKAMNALEDELSAELLSAYKDVAADPAVGAVILTGAEKAFCAGGDLKKLNEGFPTAEAGYDYMKSFREIGSMLGISAKKAENTYFNTIRKIRRIIGGGKDGI